MDKKKIQTAITMIFIAVVFFVVGMTYQKNTGGTPRQGMAPNGRELFGQPGADMNGRNGVRRSGGFGGEMAAGEILSKDANSITVKLRDGGSKIIFYSASTTVGMMVDALPQDLEIGKEVVVSGSANDDGSINAKSIQVRSTAALEPSQDTGSAVPAK